MNLKKCLSILVGIIIFSQFLLSFLLLRKELGYNANPASLNYLILGLIFMVTVSLVVVFVSIRKLNSVFKGFSKTLHTQASGINSESLHINDNSDELKGLIDSQSGSLHRIASSLDEIRAMAASNMEMAEASQQEATDSFSFTQQGVRDMTNLSQSIQKVQQSSVQMSDTMTAFVEQLSEVSQIIKNISEKTSVINDIVFQTKLLSFNASVEAARAGAEGKGFAVVAEEVGNLAAMSGQAASEISELVENSIQAVEKIIGSSKANAEASLNGANKEIAECTQSSERCAEVFSNITQKIESVKSSVDQIFSSSQEQTTGIEQLSDSMHCITSDSQNVEFIAQQVAKISSNLSEQSNDVRLLHQNFNFNLLGATTIEKSPIERLDWGPQYHIGVESMDEQHTLLVGYINDFIDEMDMDGYDHLIEPYQKLKNYTVEHFSEEEKFLKKINFPGLEGHQSIHRKLVATVHEIEKQIISHSIDKEKTAAFLKNWLISHIQSVDLKYANFYKKGLNLGQTAA